MKRIVWTAAACAAVCLWSCGGSGSVTVTVSNPLGEERSGEMVEVPVAQVFRQLDLPDTARIVVYDDKAEEVPYQITHDEKIIFPVSVGAKAVADYTICQGVPSDVNTVVYGRQYPERLDDIAWENDRAAYRWWWRTVTRLSWIRLPGQESVNCRKPGKKMRRTGWQGPFPIMWTMGTGWTAMRWDPPWAVGPRL